MRPIIDCINELRAADDLWPLIAAEISAAQLDARRCVDDVYDITLAEYEAKFRKGEAEHGRDWLRMTRADLEAEIRAEIVDLVMYHAMIRARWQQARGRSGTTRAFLSNRDPGDEADS